MIPWAIWASVLISRRAVEATGDPRLELWSQFTDIEYMLRLTARFSCVLVPRAVCHHLPPPAAGPALRAKLYSALQNGSYASLRLRQGWRILRHLPGLNYRYVRQYHWRPGAWRDTITAFFQGAILGLPSGRTLQSVEFQRALAAGPGVASIERQVR